jgi:hypothetical protein
MNEEKNEVFCDVMRAMFAFECAKFRTDQRHIESEEKYPGHPEYRLYDLEREVDDIIAKASKL